MTIGYWPICSPEIHVGFLNIAEAVIEMQAKPLKTEQLLAEMDLDENVKMPIRVISLNHALGRDSLDRMGGNGDTLWFLKRLEPAEVLTTPALLKYSPMTYNQSSLSVEDTCKSNGNWTMSGVKAV